MARVKLHERNLDSRRQTFLWNLTVLRRLERLIESKPATFERKGIFNVIDLLKRLGLNDNRLTSTVLGFMSLGQKEREKLGDVFDENATARHDLALEIQRLEQQLNGILNQSFHTIREYEAVQEEIQELRAQIESKKAALSILPARNTIPPDIWNYTNTTELKKKRLMEETGEPPRLYLTDLGHSIWTDANDLKGLIVNDRQLSDEVYLRSWRKLRTGLEGSLRTKSLSKSFLGIKEA